MRLITPTKISQKATNETLLDIIVLDYQALQIVENLGFKRYTLELNRVYMLPIQKMSDKSKIKDVSSKNYK